MAIHYCGNEIIHEYKGCEIRKVTKYYAQGVETFYLFDGKKFNRLKDAKDYINNDLITTDYTNYGGKREIAQAKPPFDGTW